MKTKLLFGLVSVLIVAAYIYTVFLIKNSTYKTVSSDMDLVSSIVYSASVVLLDAEQRLEKEYADKLYDAALSVLKEGKNKTDDNDIDGVYVRKNRVFKVLKGLRYVQPIRQCVDTVSNLPVAFVCNGFYIFAYPGVKKDAVAVIKKSRVDREKENFGLGRLFNEFSKSGIFFYAALQDENGVVYSTLDKRLFASFGKDSVLWEVFVRGTELTRRINLLDRKVMETVTPFSYGSFRGVMRIGFDATDYLSTEKNVILEITLLYIILFLLMFVFYHLIANTFRIREGYATLKEIISKADVPIVIEKRGRFLPMHGNAAVFVPILQKGRVKDTISVNGKKYMVKTLFVRDETYYLFISLDIEEMKRRLMEYEVFSTLVGEVAHEIKNPLNGISLVVQTLNMDENKSEYGEILEQVKRIEESLNRFLSIIAPLRLKKSCLSQRVLIDKALKILGILKDRSIVIKGDVKLLCDRDKIIEVYMNLIKNAYEATRKDEDIEINITHSAVLIKNKGFIPEDLLNKIFMPFYTTKKKGSGLGMYYVRKILNAHGFNITMYNKDGFVEVKIEFNENNRCG